MRLLYGGSFSAKLTHAEWRIYEWKRGKVQK